ncbi:SDR family NAD(P)-dependent oxidoreductase [Streptomyces omiyaensis]|uniref:short-chain dehydrogenase n=1 Tax=Streptomyces omiyaensis TaxID=68247 RepID=UPI0036FB5559
MASSDTRGSLCRTSRTRTRHWTADAIPDLGGRVHVVPGATGGPGLATTRALALRGGRVVLAVRDEERGRRAVAGLTGPPLDRLPDDGRVVTVSSPVHRQGRLRLGDPAGERGYAPTAFSNGSKPANAVFGHELHRRLTAAGRPVRSVLAHPGYTATALRTKDVTGLARFFYGRIGNPLLAQRPERGALPQLYAATAPEAGGGDFIGPDGPDGLRGFPTRVKPSAAAADPEAGRRLWDLSEELTGIRYGLTAS